MRNSLLACLILGLLTACGQKTENIGARRLYTVMEKLLEELSYAAGAAGAQDTLNVDAAYVEGRLAELAKREDLSRYVL